MKNHLFLSFVLMLTIISCGKDGKDGIAYLEIDWDPYVYSYWDDNPNTPETINNRDLYRVTPGIYHYEYLWKDLQGNSYGEEGTYEIYINKGEKGGFLKAGKDGETEYFHLYLYEDNNPNVAEKSTIHSKKHELSNLRFDDSKLKKIYIGKPETDTVYLSGFMMVISKQKFLLSKPEHFE